MSSAVQAKTTTTDPKQDGQAAESSPDAKKPKTNAFLDLFKFHGGKKEAEAKPKDDDDQDEEEGSSSSDDSDSSTSEDEGVEAEAEPKKKTNAFLDLFKYHGPEEKAKA